MKFIHCLRHTCSALCALRLAGLLPVLFLTLTQTVAAATGYLVADKDRTDVDTFSTPATACHYWTLYRSPAGLTLRGLIGPIDYNKVQMNGLTFAKPGSEVSIKGSVSLRCPKEEFTGVEINANKTLKLLKILTPQGKSEVYVLPENVK
jgi:hypothetical protein